MFQPLSLCIGLRYTRAKRRNHFVSFISFVSMAGLTLGVCVLILVLSVMNGFDREMRERILGVVPHVSVYGREPIDNWQELKQPLIEKTDSVIAAAPFVHMEGMLAATGKVSGAIINGIDPKYEHEVNIISEHFIHGELDNLQAGEFGIALGDLLAAKLGVGMGDKLALVLPQANLTPAGVLPRLKRVRVTGIFSLGSELDSGLGMMNIKDVAKMKGINGKVEGIRLKLDDLFYAPWASYQASAALGGDKFYSTNWTRQYGNLFQSIQMEKRLVGLLLFLIIAVAAFNIVSSLVMVVTDKRSDIAILRTFGATKRMILSIFIVQGSMVGVIGTLLGTILGVIAALNISEFIVWVEQLFDIDFLSAETYFISYLPSQLILSDVITITSASFFISILATIYPAFRAAKVDPADALRYE